jgi:beta-glucosidase-like glycosyl hydrolase
MMDAGVERLGIPGYMNLVETNSAVASSCVSENVCATNFPSPATLAASFNRSLWHKKGEVPLNVSALE